MEENDEETNGATKDNDGDEGEEKSPELNIQPGETIQGSVTSYRVIRRIGELQFKSFIILSFFFILLSLHILQF